MTSKPGTGVFPRDKLIRHPAYRVGGVRRKDGASSILRRDAKGDDQAKKSEVQSTDARLGDGSVRSSHHSLHPIEPILKYDRSAHPFRAELVTEPWTMTDGRVRVPSGPGLGIEVRMDTVRRYSSS